MIWYGGRISILIGGLATVISTFIAVVVGAFSGVAPAWLDELIMRFTEIFLSIPTLLLIILLQAIMGDANILSLSFVIGVTKLDQYCEVVRTEVRRYETVSISSLQDVWEQDSSVFCGSTWYRTFFHPLCLW